MPAQISEMRRCRRCRLSSEVARSVPKRRTSSGMMFGAEPPSMRPNVMTAGSALSVSRAARFWMPSRIRQARGSGSTVFHGCDPWPPRPRTVIFTSSIDEKAHPLRVATSPRAKSTGMRCTALAAATGGLSRTPAWIMASLPQISPGSVPSSSAWNMSFTHPGSSLSRSFRMRAAPNSMAVWPSWPQACMLPLSAAKGRPVCSAMGKASMSARSMKQGPAFGSPTSPTMPPATSWDAMPSSASLRCT